MTTGQEPRSGDVLYISRAASVQFVHPFYFRVIRKLDWITYDGWMWVDGYQLGLSGDAVARRSLFVKTEGARVVTAPKPEGPQNQRRSRRSGAKATHSRSSGASR